MKRLLLINLFFLSGCCAFTSKDCDCDPPKPELDEKTIEWITPYENQEHFIFTDSIGNIDSLQVHRVSTTEFCGGDECGSDCQVEVVTLNSTNNSNITFSITASIIREIRINNREESQNKLFAILDALNKDTFLENENTVASIINDYEWRGQPIEVLEIKCKDDFNCFNFRVKEMVVSKKFGLIKYTTNGINWEKRN